jgi:D-sedoheptulose 7-phosphate isomerase
MAHFIAPKESSLNQAFQELIDQRRGLLENERYEQTVLDIVAAIVRAFRTEKKLYWMGNGGSAADAQHLAAEFTGRFLRTRPGLPSESLTCNTSTLTAIGNDFGYEQVFARQVEAFARPGDVFVGISTTGNSTNIVRGIEVAKEKGAITIALSGNGGGAIAKLCDIAFIGPDGYSALVQEVHITIGHIICDLVERTLYPEA